VPSALNLLRVRNIETYRERLFFRYQQKCQQIGWLGAKENKQ
jgi:hypothetical protein